MTYLAQTTRALEQLTLALISLDDEAKARDFFRTEEVGVEIAVTLDGEIQAGEMPDLEAAAHAARTLREAALDPELVLQAKVQARVKQLLDMAVTFQSSLVDDLKEVSGFNEAARERAMADLINKLRTRGGQ